MPLPITDSLFAPKRGKTHTLHFANIGIGKAQETSSRGGRVANREVEQESRSITLTLSRNYLEILRNNV